MQQYFNLRRSVARMPIYRCLQVSNYPHGKVAAGLAVTVPLQLVADRAGALKEVLSFVAEDGITDVIITAEVCHNK